MAVDHVLMVHGYSVRQLNAYGRFPALLSAEGIPNNHIMLSAFLSLDDDVTCDDLALALEDHVTQFEKSGGTIARAAVLCHSTGAIVARRWILNRLAHGLPLPSHLVTFAGANHGSTLAQVGRTAVARLFRGVVEQSSVGAGVLTDLDYGSSFLWGLNTTWLTQAKALQAAGLWWFSLGGDAHNTFAKEVFWQVGEDGSDSVVRISGANLNYTVICADPQGSPPLFQVDAPSIPVPHLVIPGYSHDGIIGNVRGAEDAPFAALLQALSVTDAAGYQAVVADWTARTHAWSQAHLDQVNATIVFRLRDEAGRPISDYLVLFQDPHEDAHAVSPSLEPHQPIQNAVEPSSVSFYVNHARFMETAPHVVHIEARSGSPAIDYRDVDYTVARNAATLVRPNECTYADIRVARNVDKTYSIVSYNPARDVNATWPPLPT